MGRERQEESVFLFSLSSFFSSSLPHMRCAMRTDVHRARRLTALSLSLAFSISNTTASPSIPMIR